MDLSRRGGAGWQDNAAWAATGQAASGGPPLEALVAGEWVTSSDRRCFRAETSVPLDSQLGSQHLGEVDLTPSTVWARVAYGGLAEGFDLRQAVFIDTETTGLGRGAGTYCFLVGVGTIDGDVVRVRQFFMPDLGEEEAILDLVGHALAGKAGLVTFNGRGFDWPLLEARYMLARRPPPHRGEPHLDLLPIARRIWRRSLASCALSALEREVLGIERTDQDVPGYVIPQLYLDYVQRGRTRPMSGVFYHNAMDVLGMVALAARIGRLLTAPAGESDAREHLALARLHARQGDSDRAESVYRTVLQGSRPQDVPPARRELSTMLKRTARYAEAMDLWWGDLEGDSAYPYVELAKQFEHRLKDRATAHRLVERALERVLGGSVVPRRPDESAESLRHRLMRLERGLAVRSTASRDAGVTSERGCANDDE